MKILNFGSLNIDYVYKLDHFVRKGETIASDMLNVYGGGKGLNQSIAMSKAGAPVFHAGAIGEDGMFLKRMLEAAGVNTEYVKILPETRTGNAVIQNDRQGDNCIILYGGANQEITKEMVNEVIEEFGEGDWLVLQNEINEIPYIVEKASEKGMKIFLNPSPMNEKIFEINLENIDCFILNEGEARALTGHEETEEGELIQVLRSEFPHADIVLTLGERGSVYSGRAGEYRQRAYKVDTVDTTAAGDTFTGYFLSGTLRGESVETSLDMAAKASAIAVSRKGAAPSIPMRNEVLSFEGK